MQRGHCSEICNPLVGGKGRGSSGHLAVLGRKKPRLFGGQGQGSVIGHVPKAVSDAQNAVNYAVVRCLLRASPRAASMRCFSWPRSCTSC